MTNTKVEGASLREVMKNLEAAGSEQTRKVYGRHGAKPPLFGVSYAHLKALRKRLKENQPLAESLWATGNHDARVLACFVADPKKMKRQTINRWATQLSNYVLTDALASAVARTPHLDLYLDPWTKSKNEWKGRMGFLLLCQVAMHDPSKDDDFFAPYLEAIEREIHHRPNRTKDAMNSALIAMGMRNKVLEAAALAAAKKIGKVEVDHGETNCKTPDAASYILKANARKSGQKKPRPKKHIGCS